MSLLHTKIKDGIQSGMTNQMLINEIVHNSNFRITDIAELTACINDFRNDLGIYDPDEEQPLFF